MPVYTLLFIRNHTREPAETQLDLGSEKYVPNQAINLIYKPHSVRSAATSKAKVNYASLQDIKKTAGWSSEATFVRFCDKEINSGSSFATSVLSCK